MGHAADQLAATGDAATCSFTGPGSFYHWMNASQMSMSPLVGQRACLADGGGDERKGIDYILALTHPSYWKLLPRGHALREKKRTTWLLVGDSTDRVAVFEWCRLLKQKSLIKNRTRVEPWSAAPVGVRKQLGLSAEIEYAAAGCTVSDFGDGERKFSLASFSTFGVLNVSELNACGRAGSPISSLPVACGHGEAVKKSSLWIAQSMVLEEGDALETAPRIAQLSRRQTVGPALGLSPTEDPTFVTLHSCLWDMSSRVGNTGDWYRPSIMEKYRAGVLQMARSARSAYPTSSRWFSTCRPLAYQGLNSYPTRTRHLQVALDSMARSALRGRRDLVEGLIDNWAVLTGLESYSTDGRHYTGSGAATMINAHLNEMFDQ